MGVWASWRVKKTWRELMLHVFEVDPLQCPRCGDVMHVIALIRDRRVIERILRHLKMWPPPWRPPKPRRQPELFSRSRHRLKTKERRRDEYCQIPPWYDEDFSQIPPGWED